jgi:hypothetical protein
MQLPHLDSLEINHDTIYNYSRQPDDCTWANIPCPRLKNLQIQNFFYNDQAMNEAWDVILLASQTLTTLHLLRDPSGM